MASASCMTRRSGRCAQKQQALVEADERAGIGEAVYGEIGQQLPQLQRIGGAEPALPLFEARKRVDGHGV